MRPREHLARRRMPAAEAMYGSGACVRATTYGSCTLTWKTGARGSGQRVEGVPHASDGNPGLRSSARGVSIVSRSETAPAQIWVKGGKRKSMEIEAGGRWPSTRHERSGAKREQMPRIATSTHRRKGGSRGRKSPQMPRWVAPERGMGTTKTLVERRANSHPKILLHPCRPGPIFECSEWCWFKGGPPKSGLSANPDFLHQRVVRMDSV